MLCWKTFIVFSSVRSQIPEQPIPHLLVKTVGITKDGLLLCLAFPCFARAMDDGQVSSNTTRGPSDFNHRNEVNRHTVPTANNGYANPYT